MKTVSLVLGVAFAAGLGIAQAKVVAQTDVHVTAAVANKQLSANGLDVPRVYVLNNKGVLLYQTPKDPDPQDTALIAAINGRTDKAGEAHPVMGLLSAEAKKKLAAAPVAVVSIETGKTIGTCPACSVYYPGIEGRLQDANASVVWVHVSVEKNDYKPAP